MANSLAERGDTLRPGNWVSSVTSAGIHPLSVGDRVTARFDGRPALSLRACAASPVQQKPVVYL